MNIDLVENSNLEDPLVSVIIVTYNQKQDAFRCVDSVLGSNYTPFEIIVVDNASPDGTAQELEFRYVNKIKLIKCDKNIYAGGGRNLGAKSAKGDFLFFIDSDNTIASDTIRNMVKGFIDNKDLSIGMGGPFTYYQSQSQKLCWVNNRISLITSLTFFQGAGEIDHGQYDEFNFIKVGHIPNAFMVRSKIFKEVGGIDEDYVMHYEESDLAEKIKRAGYKIVLFPRAKIWHNVLPGVQQGHKSFKVSNPNLVYYVTRNRIYFMRKNSGGARIVLFLFLFSNIIVFYHLMILLFNRNFSLFKYLLKGYWDGLTLRLNK